MNRQEMARKIGAGVRLPTVAGRATFDLYAVEHGMVFVPSSTGKPRETPWGGHMWVSTSVEELYDEWVKADMPGTTGWLKEAAAGRGVPEYHNASYLLATFHFFAGQLKPLP